MRASLTLSAFLNRSALSIHSWGSERKLRTVCERQSAHLFLGQSVKSNEWVDMRFGSWFSIRTSDRRLFEVRNCVARLSTLIASLAVGHAQVLLSAEAHLPPGDTEVLESRTERKDLSCQVEQERPY